MSKAKPGNGESNGARSWRRRLVLRALATVGAVAPFSVLGVSVPGVSVPGANRPPAKMRPQPGDHLVFAFGPKQHVAIDPAELIPNAPPIQALPMEPASALVRDGSRLNQLMVMKLDPARLSERTAAAAADGVVAYSAVCTHTGCAVENWNADAVRLVCTCHESEFDVTDAARVIAGPAPKPLALLPLAIEAGRLVVAGKFSRRVGAQPQV